jgi:iron-sulfur cluster repair protein YtfE (RIC family)
MTHTNPSDDAYEKIVREHERLRSLLSELKQMLFERTVAFPEVTKRLAELQSLLASHFRTEEDSGCFGDVVNHAPHLSDKVSALISEHTELCKAIGELATASQCQGQPPEWDKISSGFGEFYDKLTSHESLENELLQQVFTEDIGSKD